MNLTNTNFFVGDIYDLKVEENPMTSSCSTAACTISTNSTPHGKGEAT